MKMLGNSFTFRAAAAAFAVALLVPALAFADLQEEREDLMKDSAGVMKKLAPVFKGEAAFDGAMVAALGEEASGNFTKAKDLFPDGSAEGRALPIIWEQNGKFTMTMDQAITASNAVAAAGQANDQAAFKEAFMQLGGSCKSCHDTFRKPKE
jgi:cytochrome c556